MRKARGCGNPGNTRGFGLSAAFDRARVSDGKDDGGDRMVRRRHEAVRSQKFSTIPQKAMGEMIYKLFGVAELKYECAIVWFWSSPRASPNFGGLLEYDSPQFWLDRGAKSYPESATPFFVCALIRAGYHTSFHQRQKIKSIIKIMGLHNPVF